VKGIWSGKGLNKSFGGEEFGKRASDHPPMSRRVNKKLYNAV